MGLDRARDCVSPFQLRLSTQSARTSLAAEGVCRHKANHRGVIVFTNASEVRGLPSTGITRPRRYYAPVRLPFAPPSRRRRLGTLPPNANGSPPLQPIAYVHRAVPTTPVSPKGAHVDAFPFNAAFPGNPAGRRSQLDFRGLLRLYYITARRFAQPPKAAFVTRLQSSRLLSQTARQLPDPSTSLRVESSSNGDTHQLGTHGLRGHDTGPHPLGETRIKQ